MFMPKGISLEDYEANLDYIYDAVDMVSTSNGISIRSAMEITLNSEACIDMPLFISAKETIIDLLCYKEQKYKRIEESLNNSTPTPSE